MIQAHGVLYASILVMRISSWDGPSRQQERRIKPARVHSRKGCYAAFISGGERVTISKIVQSKTIASSVPFCFRLSIATGDGRSKESPHGQRSASS